MTTYKGNTGVVKISTNAIAEITNFSITETEGTVEDTVLGDAYKTFLPDELPEWSGSVNCRYYPGDTNGQALCLVGETLTFEFSPIGTSTGRVKLTGSAIVTSRQTGDVANATIVALALQIKGAAGLTHGTHS